MYNNVIYNSIESCVLLWFHVQVQGVKLPVGCELMFTFNNIQVHCKLIVSETGYWLAPFKDYCLISFFFHKIKVSF